MSRAETAYAFAIGQDVVLQRLSNHVRSAPEVPYFGEVVARHSRSGKPVYDVLIKGAPKPTVGLKEDWLRAIHAFHEKDRVLVTPTVSEARLTRSPAYGNPPLQPERPRHGTVCGTYIARTNSNEPAVIQDWHGRGFVPTYAVHVIGRTHPQFHLRQTRLQAEPALPN